MTTTRRPGRASRAVCAWLAAALLVALAHLAGCGRRLPPQPEAAPLAGTLAVVGSSTMAPLVVELAAGFRAVHPGMNIDVRSTSGRQGIVEIRAGRADIGLVGRALGAEESDLVGFSVARDGIGFLVHRDNPVRNIATTQVRDVFTGGIGNWRTLGGEDAPIEVVSRPPEVSAAETVWLYLDVKPGRIQAAEAVTDNAPLFRLVMSQRHSVSFVSIGESERWMRDGAEVRLLALDGIEATSQNVRTGRYPLARSLTMATKSLPTGAVQAFVEYALSPEAAPVIARYGFIPYVD